MQGRTGFKHTTPGLIHVLHRFCTATVHVSLGPAFIGLRFDYLYGPAWGRLSSRSCIFVKSGPWTPPLIFSKTLPPAHHIYIRRHGRSYSLSPSQNPCSLHWSSSISSSVHGEENRKRYQYQYHSSLQIRRLGRAVGIDRSFRSPAVSRRSPLLRSPLRSRFSNRRRAQGQFHSLSSIFPSKTPNNFNQQYIAFPPAIPSL